MNIRSQWFGDFIKWFFNASPNWVDERTSSQKAAGTPPRVNRRVASGDRRRDPVLRSASQRRIDRRGNCG